MHKRVSRSGAHLTVVRIIESHEDVRLALTDYLRFGQPHLPARLIGATPPEVSSELLVALDESSRQASLIMLAAVEAVFRLDYLYRCEARQKDPLSRTLRERLYKEKGGDARFEEILAAWREEYSQFKNVISDFRGAMRYRNWLAHGRYWQPTLGQNYDFTSVALISSTLMNSLPFMGL